MSLDNIHLPDFIIQDLFQKTLVDLTENQRDITGKSKAITFFGGNRQQIVLLVNNADATFVTDEQLTFLSGILTACRLTLEDVALVNISKLSSLSYKTLTATLTPKVILMFGIGPETIELPLVMPQFQRQPYNNQVYLSAPTLNELENNKDLKRKLWSALQQIFSL